MHPLAQRAFDRFVAAFDHGGKRPNPRPAPLMMRVFTPQDLPKNKVVKPYRDRGFDSFVQMRGRTYLVKHRTWYRLDRLAAA